MEIMQDSVCFNSSTEKDFIDAIKKCSGIRENERVWLFENPVENAMEVFTGDFGNLRQMMLVNDFEMLPCKAMNVDLSEYIDMNIKWGNHWQTKLGRRYGNIRQIKNARNENLHSIYESYADAFARYWDARCKDLKSAGEGELAEQVLKIKQQFLKLVERVNESAEKIN